MRTGSGVCCVHIYARTLVPPGRICTVSTVVVQPRVLRGLASITWSNRCLCFQGMKCSCRHGAFTDAIIVGSGRYIIDKKKCIIPGGAFLPLAVLYDCLGALTPLTLCTTHYHLRALFKTDKFPRCHTQRATCALDSIEASGQLHLIAQLQLVHCCVYIFPGGEVTAKHTKKTRKCSL